MIITDGVENANRKFIASQAQSDAPDGAGIALNDRGMGDAVCDPRMTGEVLLD